MERNKVRSRNVAIAASGIAMGQVDREVAERVRSFMCSYVQRHDVESRHAQAVLRQLGTLLDDAIVRLSESFEGLSDLASDGHAVPNGEGDRFDAMKVRLGEALTALQFHDIATQLIAQSARRMAALDALTAKLEHLSESPLDTLTCEHADELNEQLTSTQPAWGWTSVTQSAMTVGEAELF